MYHKWWDHIKNKNNDEPLWIIKMKNMMYFETLRNQQIEKSCQNCSRLWKKVGIFQRKVYFSIISFICQDTLTTYLPSKIIEKHLLNLLVKRNYENKWKSTLKFFMHIHLQVSLWEIIGRAKVNGFQILREKLNIFGPKNPTKISALVIGTKNEQFFPKVWNPFTFARPRKCHIWKH